MEHGALVVAAAVLAVATVIGCALVRIVPSGHHGVVIRAGRVVRTTPSGLLVAVPVVERVEIVILHPKAIDPLSVTSLSRDGVELRLVVSVLWRVIDPELVAQEAPDPRSAVADSVERTLHRLVASVDLASVLRDRSLLLERLLVAAVPLVSPLGVELVDVDLLDADVRVGPELLRLLA